jgi:LysM repeat protein
MPKAEAKKESKKLPPAYKTEVQEIDGNKYIIHEVKEGETMFNISLIYNLKFPVVQAANPEKGDLIYAGDQIKLPIPPEVMFYQEFFDYNITDINTNSEDFKNFLIQVEKLVKENGKAIVMIASSSSKVPSSKESNKDLSVKRANKAKEALVASLVSKGITADKLTFADLSTLVRGPEYQNDAVANRATYKNYQYVKIIVK